MADVTIFEPGMNRLKLALGYGMLNAMHFCETRAKAEAPVRGGYRSFRPGTSPIGGTLRRSIHSVVYVDGRPLIGSGQTDDNGNAVPDYAPGRGIVGFCGTNSGYGYFVEAGTVRMRARPFLGPAFDQTVAAAPALIAAGARRLL
jgi:HK97 gp10 family phage protein